MGFGDMQLPAIDPLSAAWMQYSRQTGLRGEEAFRTFQKQYEEAKTLQAQQPTASTQTPLAQLLAEAEQKRIASLKEQGLNPDGSPIQPEFRSALDADGNLQDKFRVSPWQNVTNNTEALDKFKGEALRDAGTNSAWANAMLQKLGVQTAMAADQAAAGANQSMLSAASQLAQSGGLSGGSRERLMAKGAQTGFIGRQAANRQGLMDRMNVLTQDESSRVSQLKDLQGMQNQQSDLAFRNQQQATNVDQYNNRTLLGATDALNQFNQNNWNKRMEVWGANKQADAQSRASSGGGKK